MIFIAREFAALRPTIPNDAKHWANVKFIAANVGSLQRPTAGHLMLGIPRISFTQPTLLTM